MKLTWANVRDSLALAPWIVGPWLFSAFGSFFIARGLLQRAGVVILVGGFQVLFAVVFQGWTALQLAYHAGVFSRQRKITRLRQIPFSRILGLGILVNLIPIIAGSYLTESGLIEFWLLALFGAGVLWITSVAVRIAMGVLGINDPKDDLR